MSKAIFFLGLILLVFGCSPGTKKQEVSGKAKDPNPVKNSDSAESADTCPKNICGESESCEIFTQQNSNYETSEIAFLFQLKYPALTGNIEIYIDGVLVPQGDWNYLQDQNAIRIGADAFLKEEGSVVKVTYNTTEAINKNCVGSSNPTPPPPTSQYVTCQNILSRGLCIVSCNHSTLSENHRRNLSQARIIWPHTNTGCKYAKDISELPVNCSDLSVPSLTNLTVQGGIGQTTYPEKCTVGCQASCRKINDSRVFKTFIFPLSPLPGMPGGYYCPTLPPGKTASTFCPAGYTYSHGSINHNTCYVCTRDGTCPNACTNQSSGWLKSDSFVPYL